MNKSLQGKSVWLCRLTRKAAATLGLIFMAGTALAQDPSFGNVSIGQKPSYAYQITNTTSGYDYIFGTASFLAGSSSAFTITQDTCSGNRITFGQTCQYTIQFKPTFDGFCQGRLGYTLDQVPAGNPPDGNYQLFLVSFNGFGVGPSPVPPAAIVSVPSIVTEGLPVTLDGLKSYDPIGFPLTYSWTQVQGPSVTLNVTNPATPTFVPPIIGSITDYEFELTVSNGYFTNSAVVAFQSVPSNPVTITVNDTTQGATSNTCTLANAINTANTGMTVGGCTINAASSQYLILLEKGATYTFTTADNFWYGPNALPPIASTIVIQGNGATLHVATSVTRLRFFYVGANFPLATAGFNSPGAGNLTLENLTLTGGVQQGGASGQGGGGGGMGGAIFNQGVLTLSGVTLLGNTATGGSTNSNNNASTAGGLGADAALQVGGGFGGAVTPAGSQGYAGGGAFGFGGSINGEGGGGGFGPGDSATATQSVEHEFTGGGTEDGLGGRGSSFGPGGHGSGSPNGGGGVGGGGGDFGGGGFGGGGGGSGGSGGFGGGGHFGGFGGGGDFGGGGGFGGAVFNHGGVLTVTNSTFTGNSATGGSSDGGGAGAGFGGAIFNLNGFVTLQFSTLAGNTVTAGTGIGDVPGAATGGAIYSLGYNLQPGQTASLTLDDTILSNSNSALGTLSTVPDLVVDAPASVSLAAGGGVNAATSTLTYLDQNLIESTAILNGATITANGYSAPIATDPGLVALAFNNRGQTETLAISTTSPAFEDATCEPSITTVDQNGTTRPQGTSGKCSIGAYEPVVAALTPQTIKFASIGTQGLGTKLTLTASASSGLPINFMSTTSSVCSVSGATAALLTIGTCTIRASQTGNTVYAAATPVSQSFSVLTSDTVTLGISSGTQTYGVYNSFAIGPSFKGSPVPTGTVTLYDNGIALVTLTLGSNGVAYYTANPLNAGMNAMTASYSGDSHYAPGVSAPVTLTVTPAPVKLSGSCWGGTPYNVAYQCVITVSAATGTPPTGSITYSLDGAPATSVPLSKGSASITVPTLPAPGAHKLAIAYAGQGNYAAGTTLTESFTTAPGQTQLLISPSSYYVAAGSSLTLTVTASTPQSGVPTGSVTFYDNGASIGSATIGSNGIAMHTVSSIPKGSHSYTAKYAATVNYAAATSGSAAVTAH